MTGRLLTTQQVADRWQIPVAEVRHLIRARQLGHRVLNPLARRPTYRISEQHLRDFEQKRDRPALR